MRCAERLARLADGAAAHDERARAPGRRRERHVERVALQNLDAVEGDADHLVRDLGEGRLVPLAVRVGADPDLEVAVGGEPRDGRLVARHHRPSPAREHARAVRALLAEDREADADEPAVRLAALLARAHARDVDRGDGAAQALRIVAAVEVLRRPRCRTASAPAAPGCAAAPRRARCRRRAPPHPSSARSRGTRRFARRRGRAGSGTCWSRPPQRCSGRRRNRKAPAAGSGSCRLRAPPRSDRPNRRRHRPAPRSRCRAGGRRRRRRR